jgi:hypothetical protein
MLSGLVKPLVALIGVSALFVAYAFLLPLAVMGVVLMICRYIPLTGWRGRSSSAPAQTTGDGVDGEQ